MAEHPVRSFTRLYLASPTRQEAEKQPVEIFRVTNALPPSKFNGGGHQGFFYFGRHFVGRALLSTADALTGPAQRKLIAVSPRRLTRTCLSSTMFMSRRSLRFGLP
jgi:hypothetical protein